MLYIGDCKMAALATRAFVEAGEDYYLCPLSESQLPAEELEVYLKPVWSGQQELESIYREQANGEKKLIAKGNGR